VRVDRVPYVAVPEVVAAGPEILAVRIEEFEFDAVMGSEPVVCTSPVPVSDNLAAAVVEVEPVPFERVVDGGLSPCLPSTGATFALSSSFPSSPTFESAGVAVALERREEALVISSCLDVVTAAFTVRGEGRRSASRRIEMREALDI
jgi:hypothetical protein